MGKTTIPGLNERRRLVYYKLVLYFCHTKPIFIMIALRKILLLTALLFSPILSAQVKSIADCEQVALAKDGNGEKVMFYYIPTKGLKTTAFDEKSGQLTLIDDEGYRKYDTETMTLLSHCKIDTDKDLMQTSDSGYLFYSTPDLFSTTNKPYFYGLDGKLVWKGKENVFMGISHKNVLICNKGNYGDKKPIRLMGYELSSGRELWRTELHAKNHSILCGIRQKNYDSDSLYLIADSLLLINLRTGCKLAGRPFNVIGKNDRRTGLHSNWIVRGDSMFIADADSLYCLDSRLNSIWQTALPTDLGARSRIRINDGKLYLQNFGFGVYSYGFANQFVDYCHYGRPFAATYDVKTGKQISLSIPEANRKIITDGCYVDDNRIYWQAEDKFYYSSVQDSIMNIIKWKRKTDFEPDKYHPNYVLHDTIGVVRDGKFVPICTDKNHMVVEVFGKDINVVSPDGTCRFIPSDSAYVHYNDNVYSTNGIPDRPTSYVIIDPVSREIRYSFFLKGFVYTDRKGNIIVHTKTGLGFLPHRSANL